MTLPNASTTRFISVFDTNRICFLLICIQKPAFVYISVRTCIKNAHFVSLTIPFHRRNLSVTIPNASTIRFISVFDTNRICFLLICIQKPAFVYISVWTCIKNAHFVSLTIPFHRRNLSVTIPRASSIRLFNSTIRTSLYYSSVIPTCRKMNLSSKGIAKRYRPCLFLYAIPCAMSAASI